MHRHTLQTSKNKEIVKLLKPTIINSLLQRENRFKQIYNNAYKQSLESNNGAHKYRNKHKLSKPLEIGQKVLLENHKIDLGKPKKLQELRSGPYTVTNKITNVDYEVTLDSNTSVIKVAHRNHLDEYYHSEETIPELTLEYGIDSNNSDIFYKNLMTSQISKLNSPLTKHSFQNPCVTEYLPVERISPKFENLDKGADSHRTPSKSDSGFKESVESGPSGNNRNFIETHSSTPTPLNQCSLRLPDYPNLSPIHRFQSNNNQNFQNQNPQNTQIDNHTNVRSCNRSKKAPSRYQAGFT